jgi:hypothetical protein
MMSRQPGVQSALPRVSASHSEELSVCQHPQRRFILIVAISPIFTLHAARKPIQPAELASCLVLLLLLLLLCLRVRVLSAC